MHTQEATIFTAVIISAVVIGLFIVFFIASILRQQKKNLELSRQIILSEMTAIEQERTRIANDLHDDLGPVLSVIKFQVQNVTVPDEDEQVQLQQAAESLDNLINRMREISNNLMPHILTRKGLWASLENFVERARRTAKLKIELSLNYCPDLPQERAIHVFRILQEIVHNILKHAGATELKIQTHELDSQLYITCIDNGQGFDYEKKVKESTGLGLKNIKSRTLLLKGHLQVESKPQKGTAYQITIPIS